MVVEIIEFNYFASDDGLLQRYRGIIIQRYYHRVQNMCQSGWHQLFVGSHILWKRKVLWLIFTKELRQRGVILDIIHYSTTISSKFTLLRYLYNTSKCDKMPLLGRITGWGKAGRFCLQLDLCKLCEFCIKICVSCVSCKQGGHRGR